MAPYFVQAAYTEYFHEAATSTTNNYKDQLEGKKCQILINNSKKEFEYLKSSHRLNYKSKGDIYNTHQS